MRSNSREIEAALIICAENPQAVVEQIAGMTSIGNYHLLPEDSSTLHDFYFDRPDGALQTREWALRLRESEAARWLALKGPSRPTSWGGGVERIEFEAPWSKDAVINVVKELTHSGIDIPWPSQDFDYTRPSRIMVRFGLEVVQERVNRRRLRYIVKSGDSDSNLTPLAELAVDSVVYCFGDRKVGYHEVEIEAKAEDGGATLIKTVMEDLVAMYAPTLRKWDHSKLVTGYAIERLLRAGALEGLLDVKGDLRPTAFDKICDYLKGGDV